MFVCVCVYVYVCMNVCVCVCVCVFVCVCMFLLDLSAAFDTTDHETLLSRVHHAFGISDTALSRFRSYLFDCTQAVSVNGNSSSPSVMKFGVPRGSMLGPILFALYTQPLSDSVHHHSLSHHSFSADNQLYKSGHILQLQDIRSKVSGTRPK